MQRRARLPGSKRLAAEQASWVKSKKARMRVFSWIKEVDDGQRRQLPRGQADSSHGSGSIDVVEEEENSQALPHHGSRPPSS